ncbi:50S ribosomal protein L25 [Planctomycetota bacterium]|nr:50S ribosomal protein L25 [Planctomycetota bacterium]
MDIPTVVATRREESGTNKMRRFRAEGKLPGVMYGKKQENINLTFSYADVVGLVKDSSLVVNLEVDGKTETVLMRGLQRDHLGDHFHHVDFLRIDLSEKVRLRLPINFVGTPIGAATGGLLEIMHAAVDCLCPADRIPKRLEVKVVDLKVDDSIQFKDLELPEGAELLQSPDAIVIKCAKARRAAALDRAAEVKAGAPADPAAPAGPEKK